MAAFCFVLSQRGAQLLARRDLRGAGRRTVLRRVCELAFARRVVLLRTVG